MMEGHRSWSTAVRNVSFDTLIKLEIRSPPNRPQSHPRKERARKLKVVLSDRPQNFLMAQPDVIEFITVGMRYRNKPSFILRDCIYMPHYGQLRLKVIARRIATHRRTKRNLVLPSTAGSVLFARPVNE